MTEENLDALDTLDTLLASVDLTRDGVATTVNGADPVVPSRLRLATAIGVPMLACAVGAVQFHRLRGGPTQSLHVDLREAVHHISPGAFWNPTVAGAVAPHGVIIDNPFTFVHRATRDGRHVMPMGVYPHLAAKWCRFLDVPPDPHRVIDAIQRWDAFELEEAANAVGLPVSVVRTPQEWAAHAHGSVMSATPVVSVTKIGDAPPAAFGAATRPFEGVRVLSFTQAVAGPTVGRTLAEQGADVLGATRPNDFEHEFIYDEANVGSRSAYVDLGTSQGQADLTRLLAQTHVVVNNHRVGVLERQGLDPSSLAARTDGLVYVSVSCYGTEGPWATRGGFDQVASAAAGLMTIEGSLAEPRLPVTGLFNDYLTGYLGALGATAGLVRRQREGGSWHVSVSLTRSAMWAGSLGVVDPTVAGSAEAHQLVAPRSLVAPTPLGELRMLAPAITFERTPGAWRAPLLVSRGSSRVGWRDEVTLDPSSGAEVWARA